MIGEQREPTEREIKETLMRCHQVLRVTSNKLNQWAKDTSRPERRREHYDIARSVLYAAAMLIDHVQNTAFAPDDLTIITPQGNV